MEVAFDTSALGEMTSATIPMVVRRASDSGIILPYPVIAELADGSDEDGAIGRLKVIRELRARAGSKVIVSGDLDPIIEREIRGPHIQGTPRSVRDADAIRSLLCSPRLDLDGVRRVRADIPGYLQKDVALHKDRAARTTIGIALPEIGSDQARAVLRDFPLNCMTLNNPTFATLVRRYGLQLRLFRRMPHRFATAGMYAAYTYLIMIGASFAEWNPAPLVLRGPRSGSWVDARIAACAVRARVFVTNDSEQRAKVDFIAREFGIGVRACSLEEWLGESAAG